MRVVTDVWALVWSSIIFCAKLFNAALAPFCTAILEDSISKAFAREAASRNKRSTF
jgi:hypothetical protein